jgi:hypothetical protein
MTAFDLIRQAVMEELEHRRPEIELRPLRWVSIKIILADDESEVLQTTFQSERKRNLAGRNRESRDSR